MENQQENQQTDLFRDFEKNHKRGKIIGGVLLITVGSLLMARELGAEIPNWMFSWKIFLIALGVYIGFKHNFRSPSWIILILIGMVFTIADIYPELYIKPLLWPFLIILFGLFMIFRPRRNRDRFKYNYKQPRQEWQQDETNKDDFMDSITFMGGIKKKITSKTFKGGEVTVMFGGAELDFIQADLNERAVLGITQIFGGTKLIVPANWEIKSELFSIFGSIEDKRPILASSHNNEQAKVLILKGTSIFGGIDIKSF